MPDLSHIYLAQNGVSGVNGGTSAVQDQLHSNHQKTQFNVRQGISESIIHDALLEAANDMPPLGTQYMADLVASKDATGSLGNSPDAEIQSRAKKGEEAFDTPNGITNGRRDSVSGDRQAAYGTGRDRLPYCTENSIKEAEVPKKQSEASNASIFSHICHPNVDEAVRDVDGWFLGNWKFPDQKSRKKFVAAGFSRVTCLYFPKALESRIRSACKLLTILFLVDDQLEYMSLEKGKAYNESLMPFCTGNVQPNRNVPVEWMMYDIWEEMRALDKKLADDVVEPVFLFMRAQTAKERLSINDLHQYLWYRQGDVGQALLAALMRFSYSLHLSSTELDSVSDIERNCGKHISLVNDIFSYEKEKLISEKEASEGAILCNAVQILADQVGIPIESAKSVLWLMIREYEHAHRDLVNAKNSALPGLVLKDDLLRYVNGLEYQMSGNEQWSKTTARYRQAKAELNAQTNGGSVPEKRPATNEPTEKESHIRKKTGDASQPEIQRRDTPTEE